MLRREHKHSEFVAGAVSAREVIDCECRYETGASGADGNGHLCPYVDLVDEVLKSLRRLNREGGN